MTDKPRSTDNEQAAAPQPRDDRRRWWWRRRFWLLLGLIILITFHALILRSAVGLLIVQQSLPDKVDAIFADGGDALLEESVERFGSGYCREILIERGLQNRTDLLGITVPDHVLLRERLVEHNIPSERITLLGDDRDHGEWRMYRLLGRWLRENSRALVVVFCERLDTHREHIIARRLLTSDEYRRVTIHGLPHTTFDVNHWWKSRQGWKQVFNSSVGLIFSMMWTEEQVKPVTWDADKYERELVEREKQHSGQAKAAQ